MKIKELGTVFMRVSDLDRAVTFYSEVMNFQLRNIEQWDDGRGANYIFPNQTILLTLIEQTEDFQPSKQPSFNLFCQDIKEQYEQLKQNGIQVSELQVWSSEWNDHIDFDIYDPDGNAINLIEWKARQ